MSSRLVELLITPIYLIHITPKLPKTYEYYLKITETTTFIIFVIAYLKEVLYGFMDQLIEFPNLKCKFQSERTQHSGCDDENIYKIKMYSLAVSGVPKLNSSLEIDYSKIFWGRLQINQQNLWKSKYLYPKQRYISL